MKLKPVKCFVCAALVFLLFLPQTISYRPSAEEAVKISLEYDSSSTKSEIRFDVVISQPEKVGAFQAEYGYNSGCLQFKGAASDDGGEVYTVDENGTVSVIYMNKAPVSQRVLTLKFKVLKEGDSTVTAYYSQVISSENTSLEFVNSNDCQISVTSSGVVSESKTPSKTASSSSSSGKVTVSKGNSSGSSKEEDSTEKTEEKTEEAQDDGFFSFQSENPAFWAFCGAAAAAAAGLMIFTAYRMGVKKAKADAVKTETEEDSVPRDRIP